MSYIGNSPDFQVAEGSVAGNLNVSGNVTITGTNLSVNGNEALVVDKTNQPIEVSSSAGDGSIKIDSSGRSFRSTIPFIQLLHNSDKSYSSGATLDDWRIYQSGNGITHSSGVLTVPVDGLYHIGVTLINRGNGGIYVRLNNVRQFRIGYGNQATGETWSTISGDAILSLSASDNIRLESEGSISYYGASTSSTVSSYYCYLIG